MTRDEPLTISREDLYELVWSKPMLDLAKDFSISDVALAKRCRRLGIPVPGRGYWARIEAGQKPHRQKLPAREAGPLDWSALTVAPTQPRPEHLLEENPNTEPVKQTDKAWLADRLTEEDSAGSAILVHEFIKIWHPAIQPVRRRVEEGARALDESKKAYEREVARPRYRLGSIGGDKAWKWRRAKSSGQRIDDFHRPNAVRVSLGTYKRALAILNAVALSAQQRGFSVDDDEKNGRIVLQGHRTKFNLRIAEQLEERLGIEKGFDGRPEKIKLPTGKLRLSFSATYGSEKFLEDSHNLALENKLQTLFRTFWRGVIKEWQKQRVRDEQECQRQEQQKRHAELARIEVERKEAVAREQERRRNLRAEASRWIQAQQIRAYVVHIEASINCEVRQELDAWRKWAQLVADDLDPTLARIRPPDHRLEVDSAANIYEDLRSPGEIVMPDSD